MKIVKLRKYPYGYNVCFKKFISLWQKKATHNKRLTRTEEKSDLLEFSPNKSAGSPTLEQHWPNWTWSTRSDLLPSIKKSVHTNNVHYAKAHHLLPRRTCTFTFHIQYGCNRPAATYPLRYASKKAGSFGNQMLSCPIQVLAIFVRKQIPNAETASYPLLSIQISGGRGLK